MSIKVRKYLTQDLNDDEKKSYIEYIKGDNSSNIWIEKASTRRDNILELKCSECNEWVSVNEKGICKCKMGHFCYDVVHDKIKKLN